tara:strand:- start:820 stop:1926 length:1107 start_codon:yes stop_codon:yes gene_type:complete
MEMHATEKKNIILGDGLCAYGTKLALENSIIFAPKNKSNHYKLNSKYRNASVLFNSGKKGLSNFYHGVTPLSILKNKKYSEVLKKINLNDDALKDIDKSGYYVPFLVPRPKIKKTLNLKNFDLEKNIENNLYFCLSVIGNINSLYKLNYLQETLISDDVVFSVGKISNKDFKEKYFDQLKTTKGTVFPCEYRENFTLSFRPVFFESVDMNYIDFKETFFKEISLKQLNEKILKSIFLRFGIKFIKVKYWECFIQKNIRSSYLFKKGKISEDKMFKKNLESSFEEAKNLIKSLNFISFKEKISNVSCGVHLGYNREILSKVPKNLNFFDTSLNKNHGHHPTIVAFCESYLKTVQKKNYRDLPALPEELK